MTYWLVKGATVYRAYIASATNKVTVVSCVVAGVGERRVSVRAPEGGLRSAMPRSMAEQRFSPTPLQAVSALLQGHRVALRRAEEAIEAHTRAITLIESHIKEGV